MKTAAMRAMLPKDVLERFLDGPSQHEELRIRVSAYVGEKLAGQDANGGAQPMDIGQIDKYEGKDEDVNTVQQRRPHDRSNQKHKQESDEYSSRAPSATDPIRNIKRVHNERTPTTPRGRRNRVRVRRSV